MSSERVTVLITDMEGSTAFTADRGDHAAVELIRVHERLLADLVVQNEGRQVKSMGDGFMIEFDSASRAVACALAIQAALANYNETHSTLPIQVRMGINTGEVIHEKGDLYGTTVNVTDRIAAKARAGQILVSPTTREEAEPDADCYFLDRGLFWLKGLREQWRLYEATPDGTPSPLPVLGERRTPFVDRDAERARLRRHLDTSLGGSGSLVFLTGEPGTGKTRLAEELGAEAQGRGMTPLFGRCYETTRSQAYTPLIETLEAIERSLEPQTFRSVLGHTAPEIARLLPQIRRSIPDLPPPADLPPEHEQRYLFASVAEALASAAAVRPLYIVWDDLHWADPSSLRFLEHLAPGLDRVPILLLGVYTRVDLLQPEPLQATIERLHRRHLVERGEVPPLENEHVHQLLSSLGRTDPPPALVERLHAETGGNVFFMEEVIRHMYDRSELLDPQGHWVEGIADRLDVPDSLKLSVHRRIESLSPDTRNMLTSAAQLGRGFGFDLIEALSGLSEDDLLDALDEAEGAGVIRSSLEGGAVSFQFAHGVIRRTLAEDLSPARRQRLHLRAADAIELAHQSSLGEHAASIAQHLRQAGALSDPGRTARFSVMAGERSVSAAAYEDAQAHLEHAISLLPPDPGVRAPVLELLGLAQRARPRRAMASWGAALDAYDEAGDLEAVARLCLDAGLQIAWWVRGHGALELVRRGLDALGDAAGPLRAGLLALNGSLASEQGDYARGNELLDDALAIIERDTSDPRVVGVVLYARTAHHFAYNEFDQAIAFGTRSVEQLRRAGDLWNLANALGYIGASYCWVGRYAEAEQAGQEASDLGKRLGNWSAVVFGDRARTLPGFVAAPDHDWYEKDGRDAYQLGEEQGFQWLLTLGHTRMGLAEFWRGNWEEALAHFEEAANLELPGASGGHTGPLILAHTYLGNHARARELLEESRSDFPTLGTPHSMTKRTLALVAIESFALLGSPEDAARLYPFCREILESGGIARGWDNRLLNTLAGVAAACVPDWPVAVDHFEAALQQVDSLPNRLEEGDACRFYAWALLRRGEPGDLDRARRLLERAVASYRRWGMAAHERLAQTMLSDA